MAETLDVLGNTAREVHPSFDRVDELSDVAAGFRRAICERPDDDAPRLVFADWLDENDYGVEALVTRNMVRCPENRMEVDGHPPGRVGPARTVPGNRPLRLPR